MPKYAQVKDDGQCICISYLHAEVDSPLMLLLLEEDDVELGDIWDGESWTRPEPVPQPVETSLSERIALLEAALDELLLGGM